jgi:multicomponent Na+:H+ antiporter subunit A
MTLRPLELLWPPTAATFLSMLALGLGLGLYVGRGLYRRAIAPAAALDAVGPERAYDGIFAGLMGVAALQTRLLQNGSLQAYVRVTLLAAVIAGGAALLRSSALESVAGSLAIAPTWFDVVLILAIAGAGVAATLQRTALASVAVLGCVGFVIALVFAVYGAPDVAMTQFAVETLIVIIFVLVIFHLPRYSRLTGRFVRRLDALVAAAVGLLMAAFTLVVIERPEPESISTFYAERSVSEGFGRNVVNVILVDFRALDTLGEVYVIGVAAIGVYTLLRVRSAATREKQPAVPDVADPSAKESREEVAP